MMAILCFEWITTVIKYKLMNKKLIVEQSGAVSQELLQNIRLGKISVSFSVKEK